MKPLQKDGVGNEAADSAERTLRLIASLPAPAGLQERVQTQLRTAPRTGRLLAWPSAFVPGAWGNSYALRGVAAAAIVCVVAGGGWRIYSHVQPPQSSQMVVAPGPVRPAGGFSIGGSVHTPDPGSGPVLTHDLLSPARSRTSGPASNPTKEPGKSQPGKSQPGKIENQGHSRSVATPPSGLPR